uniref:DUF4806 domain-containing protein n=1 Tax=Scylla olivacea TaxID=85551 RepID=A0A0P4WA64_SCYOL
MVNLLQSVACAIGSGGDDVEDVLPAPVCSLEELDDLCTKLVDETLKRKLTLYLSSLGGHNLGDTVHRIFKRLGSNGVWSQYSLKRRKGKLAFTDLPICKVVICMCKELFIYINSKQYL